MYGNNSAGKPENNKHKRYFAQMAVKPVKNLNLALYADHQSQESFENPYDNGGMLSNNITAMAFLPVTEIRKISMVVLSFFKVPY